MKHNQLLIAGLVGAAFAAATTAPAAEPVASGFTFSARVPLNIKARFTGTMAIGPTGGSRTTPNGANYNYDDGYVFNDASGSGDGGTWYWGYDNSASQVDPANHAILMSRTTGASTLSSPGMDDDWALGFELAYAHELGRNGPVSYGFELAVNYVNLNMNSRGSYRARGTRVTDSYAFTPGTTPPGATAGSVYQGTFDGPGFVVANTPFNSTTTAGGPFGTITGSHRLDTDFWGGRVGPSFAWHVSDAVSVNLSGGLAIGYLDTAVSWNETLALDTGGSFVDTGHGSDQDWRFGFYLAANLNWRLSEHWGVVGGAQYQNLQKYHQAFGTRRVELDLSKSIFLTLGLSYTF